MTTTLTRLHVLPVAEAAWRACKERKLKITHVVGGGPEVKSISTPASTEDRRQQITSMVHQLLTKGPSMVKHGDCWVVFTSSPDTCTIWCIVDSYPTQKGSIGPVTSVFFEGPEIQCAKWVSVVITDPNCLAGASISRSTDEQPPPSMWRNLWNSISLHFADEPNTPRGGRTNNDDTMDSSTIDSTMMTKSVFVRCKKKPFVVHSGLYLRVGPAMTLITEVIPVDVPSQALPSEACVACIVCEDTDVQVTSDSLETFRRVHMSAFHDTIPQAYSLDLIADCIEPYLLQHSLALFGEGDIFTVNGIQFKILATDPPSSAAAPDLLSGPLLASPLLLLTLSMEGNSDEPNVIDPSRHTRRIGPSTEVVLGVPILPHFMDILPVRQQLIVQSLPIHLQAFALLRFVGESNPTDIERVLTTVNVIDASNSGSESDMQLAAVCDRYIVPENREDDPDFFCAVCLTQHTTINSHTRVVKLPCGHLFHYQCVLHWLKKSRACPLCKQQVVVDVDPACGT